jgi:hypothetical protein
MHLDGDVRAQAEAGACKQWSAAEWLNASKVVEERRQLDGATAFKGQRQRWSELATDGDDGAVERAGKLGQMLRDGTGDQSAPGAGARLSSSKRTQITAAASGSRAQMCTRLQAARAPKVGRQNSRGIGRHHQRMQATGRAHLCR